MSIRIRSTTRLLGLAALAGLLAVIAAGSSAILFGRNFHVVIPGRVYRSAQPTARDLRSYVTRYGIQTVVNLRGSAAPFDWYMTEARSTCELDVAQEDITFSAGRLPAPAELRRLVEVLEHAEYPILIHCKRGVDRTGLTAAVVKLLEPSGSLTAARRELSVCYGYLPWGRTVAMRQFLELYEHWLQIQKRDHSPFLFGQWAKTDYCPGPFRARYELLEEPRLVAGKPGCIRLRVWNDSIEPWRMSPGTGTGIHLQYRIYDEASRDVQHGYAGLFAAEVAPGKSVDLQVPLAALSHGMFQLRADMVHCPDISFAQVGSEPMTIELVVE